MGKHKKKPRARSKIPQKAVTPQEVGKRHIPAPLRKLLRRTPLWGKIALSLMGSFLIPMFFVLRPEVYGDVENDLNKDDPFSTRFLIVNESQLGISNVQYSYDVEAKIGSVVLRNNVAKESWLNDPNRQPHNTIESIPRKSYTAINKSGYSFPGPPGHIQHGELNLCISYSYLGVRFNDTTRFRCFGDSDNWYRWLRYAQ